MKKSEILVRQLNSNVPDFVELAAEILSQSVFYCNNGLWELPNVFRTGRLAYNGFQGYFQGLTVLHW